MDDMKDFPLDATDMTWLSGLARALLGEAHAADDLVQDTALAALQGAPPGELPRRAWLGGVARRLAARRFRSEARRRQRESRVARSEALPDSAELVDRAELGERLASAARALPEPFRRTILLRYLEGASSEEIARREGKPADTVRWRVRRGLELLRAELVQRHDRDWSSWSVLLLPLARSYGEAGAATAGLSGALSGPVASVVGMKWTLAMAVGLVGAGLWFVWEPGDQGVGRDLLGLSPAGPSPSQPLAHSDVELEALGEPEAVPRKPEVAGVPETGDERVAATTDARADPPAIAPDELRGRVLDENRRPVVGATVYLTAGAPGRAGAAQSRSAPRARTVSGMSGEFRFSPSDWKSTDQAEAERFDLGVSANGFLRQFVFDVLRPGRADEVVVVLDRGGSLSGRVVDETGSPVPDLELLVHTPYAQIDHVSPSQRGLRAQRNQLGGATTQYEQCRATTDGRGEVAFSGLPTGELWVRPLDPGYQIVRNQAVEADGARVEWRVRRCLGVRVRVVEPGTERPLEKARATFRMAITFADGDDLDLGQWVGRGAGEVSFVLTPDMLPGLESRTIARATFYGTASAEDGPEVNWIAETIEASMPGPGGAVGVVDVRVEVDPAVLRPADEMPERSPDEGGPTTRMVALDVRYEDSAPFEGELRVEWALADDPASTDSKVAKRTDLGQYRVELPASDLELEVADRSSLGSLAPWTTSLAAGAGSSGTLFVILPRGGRAVLPRPEGWTGEWFVRAEWREEGQERWRGGWGLTTAETRMILSVLRPAEWRFELRPDSMFDRDPIVRTAVLRDGETRILED